MSSVLEAPQDPQGEPSDTSFHDYAADLAAAQSEAAPPPKLFAKDQLHPDPDAKVRHFRPRLQDRLADLRSPTVQRDTYGNRVFTSTGEAADAAYYDLGGRLNKASLLLSREGEDWLGQNPGVLADINRGLIALTHQPTPDTPTPTSVELSHGRNLSKMAFPSVNAGHKQSVIYLLETPGGKYVIKTANQANNMAQPYFNEMLQTQQLAHDMRKQFAAAGVELPRFLFATGQISCTEFVEGTMLPRDEVDAATEKLRGQVARYMRGKLRSLWVGVEHDMRNHYNFIRRPNGSLVCIDPFFPPGSLARLHMQNPPNPNTDS
ncbi:MAG TPA: hypothetical protein VLF67_04735 [Candidatus Saccharimonas sp.]|nr:hypothetical protein [Candidatus Saccharimonas sp.]